MSGLEVIGGISAVIAILDGSVKIWSAARKDVQFSETFQTVANRMPILLDTIQTCRAHLEPIQTTLPAEAVDGLLKTVQNCEMKAQKLRTIFDKTISGEDDQWYERYRKIARRLGKGSKVEEVMKSITEDAQNLVNYHAVKSARPELCSKLKEVMKEMEAIEPSLPSDDDLAQTFNAYGGYQNVSTGRSTQHNNINTGSGTMNNFGGITGSPVFNLGPVLPAQATFTGTYTHSSSHPVTTYVSRPDLERQLREQLPACAHDDYSNDEMRTVVVWGLGGAGKSQLVLNHIRTHRPQYCRVFWVEAGQKQTIERDYLEIHKLLFPGVAHSGSTTPVDDAITAVKSWFHRQEGRSLWVVDSADEIEDDQDASYIDLVRYLPEAPRLDRVITTRSSRAQVMSPQGGVAVGEMSEGEAAQLFRRCAKLTQTSEETETEVSTIVQELGCLALAVVLAGSYVSETPRLATNIPLYLPEYRAQRKEILNQKARPYVHRYRESVLSTWEMSFAAVQRRSVVAANLLCLLAFLNFEDIFPRLFSVDNRPRKAVDQGSRSTQVKLRNMSVDWFARRQKSPATNGRSTDVDKVKWIQLLARDGTMLDERTIEAGFATLQAYSLVSWQAEQEAYGMHQLVHAWSHDRLAVAQRQAWSLVALELLSEVVNEHEDDLNMSTRMVPHVMANFTTVLDTCGSTYVTTDRDRKSIWTVQIFLQQVTGRALGKKHPDTLASMNNLALVLGQQGQYEQAEQVHRQTLKLKEKVLGREHPDTLGSMGNLAVLLQQQGQYEQAEQVHRQTLKLKEKVLGREHPDTLGSMGNLAVLLQQQGQYEQAEQVHRQTLKLRDKVLGREHPSTLASMNNLALVLGQQGQYEQAEQVHRQTLKLKENVLGQEHPSTLVSMNNLAVTLEQQGQYEQAEAIRQLIL